MSTRAERTPDTTEPDTGIGCWSAHEAAHTLGINERTVRRAIERGELPAAKVSGTWRIREDQLDAWSRARLRRSGPIFHRPLLTIAPTAPPFRVPIPRTPLFGRDREVHDIAVHITNPGSALVTLTGPGGGGKTRLALAVASAVRGRFADGIWFVDLSPLRDPSLVLPSLIQTLELHESAGLSARERLRAWLAPRHLLVVLDNCEQVVDAAPELAWLLESCPELTILATSRVALHVSMEQRIPVLPLELPLRSHGDDLAQVGASPAAQLFIWKAQAFQPSFELSSANASTVAAICRRLEGLPLAIELAAAHSRLLSPQAMLERLDRSLLLLVDGPADQPDRLRSVAKAIAWSYDLLDPAVQRTFRAVAVFTGGFTAESAAWVVGSDPEYALRHLAILMDHNLIVAMPSAQDVPRFTMLETIREFGLSALDSTVELATARYAHAKWCFDLCRRARPHLLTSAHTQWGNVLTEDHANIREAMDYLAALEDKTQIVVLVGWLWNFWFVRNHFAEGVSWLNRALAWTEGQRTPERVLLLVGAGALWFSTSDIPGARRHGDEALAIYTEIGLDDPEYSPLTGLSICAALRDDREEARRLNDELVALLHRHLDNAPMAQPLLSITLSNMAWNCFNEEKADEAETFANDALRIMRAICFDWALVDALLLLALLAERKGEAKNATALYRESLRLLLSDRDLRQATYVVHRCTWLLSDTGDHERVSLLIGAVDTMRERMGVPLAPNTVSEREPWRQRAIAQLGIADYDRLYRVGQTLPLEDVVALAQAVEVPPPHRKPASLWSLTRREREVLDLVGEGLTDQEIADRLFVSRRTANAHVANILAKMDVSSRREAVRQARANGLPGQY